ncbi:MAG TPA: amidase family protein, partial [Tissierellaceae bacterium]
ALSAFNIIFSSDVSSNLARYDGIRYGYRAKDYDSLDQLYMKTRKEGFEDNTKKRILFGTYLLSGNRGRIYYDKALEVRQMLIEEFNNIFNTYDAIIGLSSSMSAYNINDIKDRKIKDAESLFLTYSNLLGLCSISVPSKNDGMPIGIQFTANRFEEQKLYNISQAYERMVNDEL